MRGYMGKWVRVFLCSVTKLSNSIQGSVEVGSRFRNSAIVIFGCSLSHCNMDTVTTTVVQYMLFMKH